MCNMKNVLLQKIPPFGGFSLRSFTLQRNDRRAFAKKVRGGKDGSLPPAPSERGGVCLAQSAAVFPSLFTHKSLIVIPNGV